MMNPSAVRVIDPILSNVAQGYKHAEHVGNVLFPAVTVHVSGGQVIEFGKESFRLYNARRAPGAKTMRIEAGYQGKSFSLVQDALEGKVPREYLRDASVIMPGINLGQTAVNTVMRALSLGLESEQSSLATDAANYDSDHKATLSGTDKWSNEAGKPTKDIEDGKEAIRQSVGIYPNTLLLSAQAFKAAKTNPSVIDRFKYTGRDSITTAMLATLWDLEKVVVGKAVAFDASGAAVDLWGNCAVLAYVPAATSSQEEPSYGYTYTMSGHPLVEQTYYDESAKSWIYPVTYERAPVLTGILSGYLIKDPA